jgi:hypothetical protein
MKKHNLLLYTGLFLTLALILSVAAQCGATPTPERVVETVVVEKEVE